MVFGLIVPPANGSSWRGRQNQPDGLRPIARVTISVDSVSRAVSSALLSPLTSSCFNPLPAISWPSASSACNRCERSCAITAGTANVAFTPYCCSTAST